MSKLPVQRVAYLTGEYPKVSHTFIQREVRELRALGLEVFTCTVRRPPGEMIVGEDQRLEAENTFCILDAAFSPHKVLLAHIGILFKQPKTWFRTLALAWRTRNPGAKAALYQFFYFLEAGVLAHYLVSQNVQHLHDHFGSSSGTVAMLTSELANIPFSFTLHGPDIFFEPKKWALSEKIARAKFTVCISFFCRSQAMLFSEQKHWGKLKIVHCGVEVEKYGCTQNASANKNILFVGRLAAVKGAALLLDAFANVLPLHPDAILTLIGDGSERNALERQARELGIHHAVNFAGYKDQQGVAETLATSRLLVLPSFAEGVPVVLMEALASGIPVVATQVAGVSELVKHGENGFVVPPSDTTMLSTGLEQLLSDPNLCKKMGAEGQKLVVDQFNGKKSARSLHALYTDGNCDV